MEDGAEVGAGVGTTVWEGGAPGPVVGAAVSSLRREPRNLSCQRKPVVDLGEKGLSAGSPAHPHQEMEEVGRGNKGTLFV